MKNVLPDEFHYRSVQNDRRGRTTDDHRLSAETSSIGLDDSETKPKTIHSLSLSALLR